MDTDKTYNGWTNYETWNVNLWLDNDESTQDMLHEWAIENKNAHLGGSASELADQIKDYVRDDDLMPDLGATLYADLLGAALDSVNWFEIAEALLENVDPDELDEEMQEVTP